MRKPDAGMDGEIINSLFRLLDQCIAEGVLYQVFSNAVDFFQRLINRNPADWYRRITDNPFPDIMDVAPRG